MMDVDKMIKKKKKKKKKKWFNYISCYLSFLFNHVSTFYLKKEKEKFNQNKINC